MSIKLMTKINVDENTSIAELLATRKASGNLEPESQYLSPTVGATIPVNAVPVSATTEKAIAKPVKNSKEHESRDEAPEEDEPHKYGPREKASKNTIRHVNATLPAALALSLSEEKETEIGKDEEPKEEPLDEKNGHINNGSVSEASTPAPKNASAPISLLPPEKATEKVKNKELPNNSERQLNEIATIGSSIPAPDDITEELDDKASKGKPSDRNYGHLNDAVSAAFIPVPVPVENHAAKDVELGNPEMNPTLNSIRNTSVEPNETAVQNPSDIACTTQNSNIMATENKDEQSLEEFKRIVDEEFKEAPTAKAAEAAPVSLGANVSNDASTGPINATTGKAAEPAPMTSKSVPPITTTSTTVAGSNGKTSPDTSKVTSPKTKGKSFGFGLLRRGTKELVSPVAKVEEKPKNKRKDSSKSPISATSPVAKVEETVKDGATVPAKSAEAHVPIENPKEKVIEDSKSPKIPSVAPVARTGTTIAPAVVENKPLKKSSTAGDITLPETSQSTRPKSKGVAFPFSLKRSGAKGSPAPSSASVATITSSVGIPASEDVRTPGAMGSSAASSTKAKAVEPEAAAKPKVPNGEPVAAGRQAVKQPAKQPVKSHTAAVAATGSGLDGPLPAPGFKGIDSDEKSVSSSTAVDDYLTW